MGSVSDVSYAKGLDWCSGRKWLDSPGPSMSLYSAPQGKWWWWQEYRKRNSTCHQPPMHPFHHKGLCTSWLLPETIRSPLVPCTHPPAMSPSSPNTTAALGQRKEMNQNLIPFLFARSKLLSEILYSHLIWGRGLISTYFQWLHVCVFMHIHVTVCYS